MSKDKRQLSLAKKGDGCPSGADPGLCNGEAHTGGTGNNGSGATKS